MKLTNNRLYLDYNSTTPLVESVSNWLSSGVLPFGNPSSLHSSGKKSKKLINETTDYLKEFFSLKNHEVVYHSGASEGINSILKGLALACLKKKKSFSIYCLRTDHSCVVNQEEDIKALGGSFKFIDVNESGEFDVDSLINEVNTSDELSLISLTLVNNETGLVTPLELIKTIKEKTNALIHIDAVQMIGKLEGSISLIDCIDYYTFSGHKFGAMKGVGFSFIRECDKNLSPLINGGGQQANMRSGTENTHGIYSLKLALEFFKENFNAEILKEEKMIFESRLKKSFGDKLMIVCENARNRNLNTVYMVIKGLKTDVVIAAFDMQGIDISTGSACSSGTIEPSRVLLAQGYCEDESKSSLRVSFPIYVDKGFGDLAFDKFEAVLKKFL